jgi:hypothetical protein
MTIVHIGLGKTATTALQMTGIKDPTKHDTIAAAIALKKLNGNQRRRSAGKKLFAIPAAGSEFLK